MMVARALGKLTGNCRGSAAIEFALLAPAFIAMLLGVLQVGIALQNYNALRGLSADVARYAMVKQAAGDPQSATQLQTYAASAASGSPYLLNTNAAVLQAVVAPAATPQITGVTELTLTLTYQIPSLFSAMGLNGPRITYSRPIFLTTTA